jgi:hypothetical protein
MCREDNAQRTLVAAIRDRGPALAALFARKVERLWKNSWNDFYAQSLGLRRPAQNSLHQLLLLCATVGAVYLLVTEKLLSERVAALSAAHMIKRLSHDTLAPSFSHDRTGSLKEHLELQTGDYLRQLHSTYFTG